MSEVEKYDIPDSLINLGQSPLHLVPCGKRTMAKKRSINLTILGASDRRRITVAFAITLSGNFLPIKLIYRGKTL